MSKFKQQLLVTTFVALAAAGVAIASSFQTTEDPMMEGRNGWTITPIFTVGETIGAYQPVGVLDGIGAYALDRRTVRVLVNHELNEGDGKSYTLGNGTVLTGARISYFDIDRKTRRICDAGPAYDTVYDRCGDEVTDPEQVNEDGNANDGFARFCSSQLVQGYGFCDTIYFTNEESGVPFHPHGGSVWALDVDAGDLWACPNLGRGAWENVTAIDTGCCRKVALLLGDDTQAAPLYLWVGEKQEGGNFLERNGLSKGQLYAWVADDAGILTPEDFNGKGAMACGTFVAIDTRDEDQAGAAGYDDKGYRDDDTLRAEAVATLGAFQFSRPEDLATNPCDGTEVVFASTGRGGLFPSDNWGTIYVIDVDFDDDCTEITACLKIIHDADDLAIPDDGIRSPDNLDWADDGYCYIQEDRSTSPGSLFGAVTFREASIWQLDPKTCDYVQVAEMDRASVPAGQTDSAAGDLGNWESSGVLDVSDLFKTKKGETLLIADVQAHGIRDGMIASDGLVQGGQLIFVGKRDKPGKGKGRDRDDDDDDDDRRRGRKKGHDDD